MENKAFETEDKLHGINGNLNVSFRNWLCTKYKCNNYLNEIFHSFRKMLFQWKCPNFIQEPQQYQLHFLGKI